jgi:3-dehydroquinate synthase
MHSIRQEFTLSYAYPVIFTRDLFGAGNQVLPEFLSSCGEGRARVALVVDSEVARLTAGLFEKIKRFADLRQDLLEFVAPPLVIPGGEGCKNQPQEVDRIHSLVEKEGLCRHSYIIALGGGAVLDVVGYAAATAHRGIRLIRMPTTTLAQNDAGVGVKNGVNAFGRKNFLGTFAPPRAVINDFDFLRTLSDRDQRTGIAEAIKVALIKDRAFFDQLYVGRRELAVFSPPAMERMIVKCAELHLEHIRTCDDPFEFGTSRPLDFGHWTAHKLEEMAHGDIRHGEAVAIGIALDALYSHRQELIDDLDLHRILTLLENVGFPLYHTALRWIDVAKALQEFREHLGGVLSIPLLSGIGNKIEAHEIDVKLYQECISALADREGRTGERHENLEKSVIGTGDSRKLVS